MTHLRQELKQWLFTTMLELKATKNSAAAGEGAVKLRAVDTVYLPPKEEKWVEGWKVTEELLKQMRDDVAKQHVPFVVNTLSNAVQLHPNMKVRQQFMQQLGTDTLFYPDERVLEFGKREGIMTFNIAQKLAERAAKENVFFHGFPGTMGEGHWNEVGNRVAGEAIAVGVCAALQVPSANQ